jgi:aspartyl-tRNA(Asn)/glutamyl-tRNA(Gln) amidotransferase subunit B
MMEWEIVIGLETHAQLTTASKIFSGASTAFGAPPNTQASAVDLALPGTLPVLNRGAVERAIRFGLAVGGNIAPASVFARKNYFYPDLPKGYQISQFDRPLATNGVVPFDSAERGPVAVTIQRLHLEDDAGKSLHDRVPGRTAVDLNRAGVPLAEIVGGPDLRSPAEARAWLTALRQILLYTGASDCSMEEGSLRVDANLSIRRPGATEFGTKTEVKNMNSFANVERALEAERARQIALVEGGRPVKSVTLLFDAATGAVRPTRSKEESHDYRYFPDPDLPPLSLTADWERQQRESLPELPDARRRRFETALGLAPYHAGVVSSDRPLADYFEAVVAAGAEPRAAANWVAGDVMTGYNERGAFDVAPERLAGLIALERDGVVSLQAARRVFAGLAEGDGDPRAVAERLGLLQVRDADSLAAWVDAVVAAHPAEVARYRGGETKLMGFFVGQVMKRSGGKADPKGVQPVLQERLG